jgi:alkanesulfonate monooxygenase SsuD/methylene tetrahydromethanopterin reductase-like flavin-dependent oxidoreductase (luciferase family)
MRRILGFHKDLDFANMGLDEFNERGYCIVGSPDTVRRRLAEAAQTMGYGVVLSLLQFGTMSHERTLRNMKLFSTEVAPGLRQQFSHFAAPPVQAA